MRVDVSGFRFAFPNECACCGATPDSVLAVSATRSRGNRVVHTETKQWEVPYCGRCIEHIRAIHAAHSLAKLLSFLSLLAGGIVGFAVSPFFGVSVGILALFGTVVLLSKQAGHIRAECGAYSCVDAKEAIAYLGWQGTLHRFEISSQRFACHFMKANQSKLVNVSPEARRLLSANSPVPEQSVSGSPSRYVS